MDEEKGDDIKSFVNYKNHLRCVDLEAMFQEVEITGFHWSLMIVMK